MAPSAGSPAGSDPLGPAGAGEDGRDGSTAPDWHDRVVSWVLPPAAAAWVRLRSPSAGAGAGSSARSARVLVRRGRGDAAPFGRIVAHWEGPEGQVTVRRVGWDAANGGSLSAVRRAIARLGAGRAG